MSSCYICKKRYPDMFHVQDDEWVLVVPKFMRKRVLCIDCYNKLKEEKRKELARLGILFPKYINHSLKNESCTRIRFAEERKGGKKEEKGGSSF